MPGIAVLNGKGHLSLEWDANDPEDVERIRAEVQHLKDAGYSFFLTDGSPADEVAAGRGALIVRRLDDPVTELNQLAVEAAEPPSRGRGRPRREEAKASAVAVRPMRGG